MLGDDVDDLVGQAGEVRAFPVVVPAMRDGVVDAALMVDVQRGSDQIHERSSELAERTDGTLTCLHRSGVAAGNRDCRIEVELLDRKSTRLNSSHVRISYAVFCLKKKNTEHNVSLFKYKKEKYKIK